ncbi:hypothetical protein [Streptococcus salivarius]
MKKERNIKKSRSTVIFYTFIFYTLIILSILPIFYVFIKNFVNFQLGFSKKLGYDWLAYYGSLIGSFITLQGIVLTLQEERSQSEYDRRINVRPLFNITTDFVRMQMLKDEIIPSYRILRSSEEKLKYTNFIDLKEQNTSDNDTNSILIKINNIGLGHALLEEVKCTKNNCNYELKSDEKFMIDKGTSNILLIRFDGELKGEEIVEFTLRDILDNKYLYKMRLVPTVEKIKVQRNIHGEEELFTLVKLDNAYFEEYFPELL